MPSKKPTPPKDPTDSQPAQDKPSDHHRPHHKSHDRNRESHDRSRDRDRESHEVEGPPRHGMSQYPYPPFPPQYYHGYPPPMYPPGPSYHGPPQHGYPHSQHSRHGRRGNPDDLNWRHEDEERLKRDEPKMEERPRILTKPRPPSTDQEVESVLKGNEDKPPAIQRTVSSSSDTSKHVTFEDPTHSPTTEDPVAHPPPRRALQKKPMLKKLGDQEGEGQGEKSDQQRGGNRRGHSKDSQGGRTDSSVGEGGDVSTPDGDTKARPTAWSTDRGTVGKLYEPEGKKSAAKFQKYQAQTQSRGRMDSRGSQGSTTPTADVEGRPHTPEVKARPEHTVEANRTHTQSPAEQAASQQKPHNQEPVRNQQDAKHSFPERPGPYREEHRDERPRHEQRRGDKPPPRDSRRDRSEHQRTERTGGGHQKGRESARADPGDKRRDNRRGDGDSRRSDADNRRGGGEIDSKHTRNEDRQHTEQRREKPRRDRSTRTPDRRDNAEHTKKPSGDGSKQVSTETVNKPADRSQPSSTEAPNKPAQARAEHEHREPRHGDRGGQRQRGERSGRNPPKERDDAGGERGSRPHHPKQGEEADSRRRPSQETRRGDDVCPVIECLLCFYCTYTFLYVLFSQDLHTRTGVCTYMQGLK